MGAPEPPARGSKPGLEVGGVEPGGSRHGVEADVRARVRGRSAEVVRETGHGNTDIQRQLTRPFSAQLVDYVSIAIRRRRRPLGKGAAAARARIDPYMKLIERQSDDKVVPVEMVPRQPPPG